jgi:hypothetical protein
LKNKRFATKTKVKMQTFSFIFLFTACLYAQVPDMEWHKGYGTDNGEHIHELMQTGDGGYIGIGQTDESRTERSDILVVKIDSEGEFHWQKIIGTERQFDIGICVDEAKDGYIIGGGLFEGNQQRYMAKLNYEGEFVWQHTYRNEQSGMIRGIDILENGDIVATGYKNYRQPGYIFIADNSHGFIMKTDAGGNAFVQQFG